MNQCYLLGLSNFKAVISAYRGESEENMTTYLLPTVLTGKNLPMEYRIVERKRDMRTRFCKQNEKYIIDRDTLNEYIREYGIRVKGDRVIMKDGKQASIFHVLVR